MSEAMSRPRSAETAVASRSAADISRKSIRRRTLRHVSIAVRGHGNRGLAVGQRLLLCYDIAVLRNGFNDHERVQLRKFHTLLSAARFCPANSRRDLPGLKTQLRARRTRHHPIVLRRPWHCISSGGLSRPRRRPFVRDGVWVRCLGSTIWPASPSGTPSLSRDSRRRAARCFYAG